MTGNASDDQQETTEAILEASHRTERKVPIRRSFVQRGTQNSPIPGVLSEMVRSHDERCLDLYLLHRVLAVKEPWDVRPLPGKVWARALGVHTDQDGGKAAVSKAWKRLIDKYGLIESSRSGRRRIYTALHEDGSRQPYTSPDGSAPEDVYLTLPFAYWTSTERWYRRLTLPGKAMLLIASSLNPKFLLPTEEAKKWYGVSGDTAARGFRELENSGLLTRTKRMKRTPLEDSIATVEHRFTLTEPFGRPARQAKPAAALAPALTPSNGAYSNQMNKAPAT